MTDYSDMIHMIRLESACSKMSMRDRAAQFSPFAALTGYDDAIDETARITDDRLELDEEKMEELNQKMLYLMEHIQERPAVRATYFVPDETKEGGKYELVEGNLRKIDLYKGVMTFEDRKIIDIFDVSMIEINIESDSSIS